MIEINVYFFTWLGVVITPLLYIDPNASLAVSLQHIVIARVALEGFKDGTDLQRGFPRSAGVAQEIVRIINYIVPAVGEPVPNLGSPIPGYELGKLKALCQGLQTTLRDEAQRDFVVKVEDQRCLSAATLVENIESCFSAADWKAINADGKNEFQEAGKCLALEIYTGAGFHSLRGVECAIRQYIVELTGALPKKRDWGSYIEVLKQNGADPSLTAVLDNIRSLERNPLMHPEDWLDVDQAIALFMISQTAIGRIAADMRKKFPVKYS
jgi:hypothetical protein